MVGCFFLYLSGIFTGGVFNGYETQVNTPQIWAF